MSACYQHHSRISSALLSIPAKKLYIWLNSDKNIRHISKETLHLVKLGQKHPARYLKTWGSLICASNTNLSLQKLCATLTIIILLTKTSPNNSHRTRYYISSATTVMQTCHNVTSYTQCLCCTFRMGCHHILWTTYSCHHILWTTHGCPHILWSTYNKHPP
jgi:hypothetical protein